VLSVHHVILVPGFFGFGRLGELQYFLGVRESLARAFRRAELDVAVHEVETLPTASIRHRAARVLEAIARVARDWEGPIHLVGHSTGGLDARVAIAPTASLPAIADFREYDRIQSLITIACPHHGTPLAAFFGGAAGKPALRLSAMTAMELLRHGRGPLNAAIKLGQQLAKIDNLLGLERTVADQLYDQLLSDFDDDRRESLIEFLRAISADQSLVYQLTPAGCDLLNACTADPSGVRYGCVVTRARAPRAWNVVRHAHDVYAQYLHALYSALYVISSRSLHADLPEPSAEQRQALESAYGRLPRRSDSDGIVPTLSQLWGPVIHAAKADHLDVIGNYGQEIREVVTADWLPSNSGFDHGSFEVLWSKVAEFITNSSA
jgi:triacylglycerol lipase